MFPFPTTAERMLSFAREQSFRLFISHSWSYENDYDGIKRLLSSDSTFRWEDKSIDKSNPVKSMAYLNRSDLQVFRTIEARIRESDCILVPLGMYANARNWIQTEISLAEEAGVPAIGIQPSNSQRSSRCADCVLIDRVN